MLLRLLLLPPKSLPASPSRSLWDCESSAELDEPEWLDASESESSACDVLYQFGCVDERELVGAGEGLGG